MLSAWPHRGFTTIVIAHIAFCSAYVTITVQSRLATADRSLEEAAMDLGSGPRARIHGHHTAQPRAGIGVELAAQFYPFPSTIW